MTSKTVPSLGCLILFVIGTELATVQARAQKPQNYSNRQLRRLMAKATTVDDYQKLASYFHYEKVVFRAKLEKAIDDYVIHGGKYSMATKTVTVAEAMAQLCDHYSAKADESAKLADRYDEMLVRLGVTPESKSVRTVSIKALQRNSSESAISKY